VVALRAGSATDVGLVRSNNQDSLLTADPLYAVADGMGGAAAGEVASALAIEALNNGFTTAGPPTADRLIEAAQTANRVVFDESIAKPEMRGMGTTLVAIALVEGPELAIVNIGDSRLYVLSDDELRQITLDHNLVAEMVAEGRITPAEAEVHPRRNIMTRALGVEPEVPVDLFVEEPRVGDRYLLCSDGLPREVSDDRIASVLRRLADPEEAARELVHAALAGGGNDNITVVVVDVVDGDGDNVAAGDTVPRPDDATTALPVTDAGTAGAAAAATTGATAAGRSLVIPAEKAKRARKPRQETRSPVTIRVVMFILVFVIIIVAAIGAIIWYARSSYYVGLRGQEIVIYQGRPGGVLGLNPTLKKDTGYSTTDVLPSALPALKAGQEESSQSAAEQYVTNLVGAYDQAQANAAPPSTTTTTAPHTTTTRPRTTSPTTAKP
jgi:protein phosphatase